MCMQRNVLDIQDALPVVSAYRSVFLVYKPSVRGLRLVVLSLKLKQHYSVMCVEQLNSH